MSAPFFLSVKGTSQGPYSKEDILQKIEQRHAQWTDYVYDQKVGEWVLLLEHPFFSAQVSNYLPKRQSNAQSEVTLPLSSGLKEKAWYVLKDGNNYGPFSKLEVIQMLQSRQIHEYEYVWHQSLDSWKKIADCSEFQASEVKKLKDSGHGEVAEVFFRRRHARAKYGCSLIVHDNKSLYRGKTLEISAGGAGVIIESPHFEIGHNLFLHFKPGDGVPPFNAICQVVNRQLLRNIPHGPSTPVKYGVKFTNITQQMRESIQAFTGIKVAS